MRRQRHEQALGAVTTSTLDALGDPLWVHTRAPGGEPVLCTRVMMTDSTDISGCLFVVRSSDCFRDGIDQLVRSTEVGSCSLQEEQML